MRIFFCFLLYLFLQLSFAHGSDFTELRRLYYEAASKKDSADKFLIVMGKLELETESNPLLMGYKGMAHLIHANFSYNPYTKLASFSKGKAFLEGAIQKDPQNIEIRFFRFCVQTNAPFFLGYNGEVKVDKEIILKGWSQIPDIDLKEKIKVYMLESKACSTIEKSQFK
jgi:hypothetical protein